jgi:hypothetical protein
MTDRVTVALATLAAFLVALAVLAHQLRAATVPSAPHRVIVMRRIYRTTIVDDGVAGARGGASTVSVSTSGGGAAPAAPTTRTSASR